MADERPKVELREGVVVGTTGARDLLADVYIPPEGTATGIGLVLIHGGAWRVGDREQLRGYGFLVGRCGITVVAPDYRLVDEGVWPAQIDDVSAALDWTHANATELGVHGDKVAVAGASSGGHLALMLAGTAEAAIAATIALYAPSQLVPGATMLQDSVEALLGSDADADTYSQASPISHVSDQWGPVMLMHSNIDDLVPVAQSLQMHEALQAAGVSTELHLFQGDEPHAYDMDPALGRLNADLMVSFLTRACGVGSR